MSSGTSFMGLGSETTVRTLAPRMLKSGLLLKKATTPSLTAFWALVGAAAPDSEVVACRLCIDFIGPRGISSSLTIRATTADGSQWKIFLWNESAAGGKPSVVEV